MPDQTWVDGQDVDLTQVESLQTITVCNELTPTTPLTLELGKDYTVKASSRDVGEAYVEFTPAGMYAADNFEALQYSVSFYIVDPDAQNEYVLTRFTYEKVYDGTPIQDDEDTIKAIKAASKVILNGNQTVKPANYDVTVTPVGGEPGTDAGSEYTIGFFAPNDTNHTNPFATETVAIQKADLGDEDFIMISEYSATYAGVPKEPTEKELVGEDGVAIIKIEDFDLDGIEDPEEIDLTNLIAVDFLKAGDFTVGGYSDNTDVPHKEDGNIVGPSARITATEACKNYTGSGDVLFLILPYDGEVYLIVTSPKDDLVYTGEEIETAPNEVTATAYFGTTAGSKVIPDYAYDVVLDLGEQELLVNAGSYPVTIRNHEDEESDTRLNNLGDINVTGPDDRKGYVVNKANMSSLTITPVKDAEGNEKEVPVKTDAATYFSDYFEVYLGEVNITEDGEFDVDYVEDWSPAKDAAGSVWTLKLTPNPEGSNFTGSTSVKYTSAVAELAPYYESEETFIYTGTAITPAKAALGTLTAEGFVDLQITEYIIDTSKGTNGYDFNINAGTAVAYIKGLGDYLDKESEARFTIEPLNIADLTVTPTIADGEYYEGQTITTATVTLTSGEEPTKKTYTLTDADVYTVTADDITNEPTESGDYLLTKVTVNFPGATGNFKGTVEKNVEVVANPVDIAKRGKITENAIPAGLIASMYEGEEGGVTGNLDSFIKSWITVTINGGVVEPDLYDLTYDDGVTTPFTGTIGETKKLKIVVNQGDGSGVAAGLSGSLEFEATLVSGSLGDAVLYWWLDGTEYSEEDLVTYVFNGNNIEPVVSTDERYPYKALVEDTDFTVSYPEDAKNAGEKVITVKGKGNYADSDPVELLYEIIPYTVTDVDLSELPALKDRTFDLVKVGDLGLDTLDVEANNDEEISEFFTAGTDYVTELAVALASDDEGNLVVLEPDDVFTTYSELPWMVYKVTVPETSTNFVADYREEEDYDEDGELDCFFVAYPLEPKTVSNAFVDFGKTEFKIDETVKLDELIENTTVKLTEDGEALVYGKDYTIPGVEWWDGDEWIDLSEVTFDSMEDKFNLIVNFQGCLAGTVREPITLDPTEFDINNVKFVEFTPAELVFNGDTKTPYVGYIGDGYVELIDDESYDPQTGFAGYFNGIFAFYVLVADEEGNYVEPYDAGDYTATVYATDEFGGGEGASYSFTIAQRTLTDEEFVAMAEDVVFGEFDDYGDVEYNEDGVSFDHVPACVVYDYEYGWVEDHNFEIVSYDPKWDGNPETPGKATIALRATSNYKYDGVYETEFQWAAGYLDVVHPDAFVMEDVVYNGQEWTSNYAIGEGVNEVSLDWVTKVVAHGDCTNAYANDASATIYVTVPEDCKLYAPGNYTFYNCSFNIAPASIKDATIAAIPEQAYTGKAIEPELEVTLNNAKLTKGTDYQATYTNNVEVGTATVTIKGVRNYGEETTATFTIQKAEDVKKAETKAAAEKAAETAKSAAETAAKNPTEENIRAAATAIADAEKAYDEAKNAGNSVADLKKAKDALDAANASKKTADEEKKKADEEAKKLKEFNAAMTKVPAASAVKETDRSAIETAEKAYNGLTAEQKKDAGVVASKAKLDEAKKALEYPTITFKTKYKSKKVKKNINKTWSNGQSTKRSTVKKSKKKLALKGTSSTGAKITYKTSSKKKATVSSSGVVKFKKKGKVTITATCNNTVVKVLLKIK